LVVVVGPIVGVIRASTAASTATASTASMASTATSAVLAETVFKTLAPSVVHARMERTLSVRISAEIKA
jgi:hypothetical protein